MKSTNSYKITLFLLLLTPAVQAAKRTYNFINQTSEWVVFRVHSTMGACKKSLVAVAPYSQETDTVGGGCCWTAAWASKSSPAKEEGETIDALNPLNPFHCGNYTFTLNKNNKLSYE